MTPDSELDFKLSISKLVRRVAQNVSRFAISAIQILAVFSESFFDNNVLEAFSNTWTTITPKTEFLYFPSFQTQDFGGVLGDRLQQRFTACLDEIGVSTPALIVPEGIALGKKSEVERRFDYPIITDLEWAYERPNEAQEEAGEVKNSEEDMRKIFVIA